MYTYTDCFLVLCAHSVSKMLFFLHHTKDHMNYGKGHANFRLNARQTVSESESAVLQAWNRRQSIDLHPSIVNLLTKSSLTMSHTLLEASSGRPDTSLLLQMWQAMWQQQQQHQQEDAPTQLNLCHAAEMASSLLLCRICNYNCPIIVAFYCAFHLIAANLARFANNSESSESWVFGGNVDVRRMKAQQAEGSELSNFCCNLISKMRLILHIVCVCVCCASL